MFEHDRASFYRRVPELSAAANSRVGPNFHESMYYEFETNSNKMTPKDHLAAGTT